MKGPFLLARTDINAAGWRRFFFESCPYVHRTLEGADQEARRISRLTESDIAVVEMTRVISTEVTVVDSRTLTPDDLLKLLIDETANTETPIHHTVARKLIRKIFDDAPINFRIK